MSVILFVDMLGARRRWQKGGVSESEAAFLAFTKFVMKSTRDNGNGEIEGGGVETDSAMVICGTLDTALKVARSLFVRAFDTKMRDDAPRLWLRGCIVPHDNQNELRVEHVSRTRGLEKVSIFTYSRAALEAISVEKSGYRGMRILVPTSLITREVNARTRIAFGSRSLVPFRRLRYAGYPTAPSSDYCDYLWMACADEDEWYELGLHMANRVRYSCTDPEESTQAATTQVVFHECAAIRKSVIGRARRAADQEGAMEHQNGDTESR